MRFIFYVLDLLKTHTPRGVPYGGIFCTAFGANQPLLKLGTKAQFSREAPDPPTWKQL